ncbi:MAG: signal peptidase II [Chloroflexota bacterium]
MSLRRDRRLLGMWAALLAAVVVGLDQVSKALVIQHLNPATGPGQIEVVGNWLRLSYTTNTGAAFGMFPGMTLFFTIVALLAIPAMIIFQRYLPANAWPAWISIGLMLGGTIGNLLDRLRFGNVIDFIDAGIGNLRWYTFNVADASMVIGVLILAGYILLFSETPSTDHAA